MTVTRQKGFTLVEIAIVLVIIGLLLGGILKGQELINSARVRNLADQNTGIQAAYYGFIDRYRRVPGDYRSTDASSAIGVTINLPVSPLSPTGVGNGRVDNNLEEATAVWEQLAKANFLSGGFTPADDPTPPVDTTEYENHAPRNAFNGTLVLTRNSGYTGTAPIKLNLHMGTNVPVNIARELDLKVDDGLPNSGVLRLTSLDPSAPAFNTLWADVFSECTTVAVTGTGTGAPGAAAGDGDDPTDIYDIFDDAQDCGPVFLY